MIATETIVPTRKLKIKFSTKRIEVDPGQKCEFGQRGLQTDENGRCNSAEKLFKPDSIKRGPPEGFEGQKEKRQKIDRKGSTQCAAILKCLMSYPYSWVFNKPVDPVALNIPDYFTIITKPMDLGTISSKLKKNVYSCVEEFAADVRLTFSNAMTYNPPHNDVHMMAKELNQIFDSKWKDMDKKWKCEDELGKSVTGTIKETARKSCNVMHPRQKDTFPKKSQVSEHKRILKISSLAARDAKVSVVFCEREKPYCNMHLYSIYTGIDEIKLLLLPTLFSMVTLFFAYIFCFFYVFLKDVIILALFCS